MRVGAIPREISGGTYERAESIDIGDHASRDREGPEEPGRARKHGARQRKRSQCVRAYVHKMSARHKAHRETKPMWQYFAHSCSPLREPAILMRRAQF